MDSKVIHTSFPQLSVDTRAVILDLDGTLYNKHALGRQMLMSGIADWHLMSTERRARRALSGCWFGSQSKFEEAFYWEMHRHIAFRTSFLKWWREKCYLPLMVEMIGRHHPCRSWVKPFIDTCHKAHVPIVILSDYEYATEKINALGLNPDDFAWIISAPALGGLKPAPMLLKVVVKHIGVAPSDCLVIGDRKDTDGAMAKAVGAQFWKV